MLPDRFNKLKTILTQRQPDLTVLLENVEKPHNLAAIARTCDAVGIDEIHAVTSIKGLRLSQMAAGGIRRWVTLNKYKTTEAAYDNLKSQGLQLVVTHLSDNTIDYKDIDYTKPTAIIAGSEYDGVSDYAIEHADHCIAIPMLGMVQSLNVSVAMSIILYEALEQRKKAGMYDESRMNVDKYKKKLFEWTQPRVSQRCKERKESYPELDDEGQIVPIQTTDKSTLCES